MSADARFLSATTAASRIDLLRRRFTKAALLAGLLPFFATTTHASEQTNLSDADRKELTKVEDYLNGLDTVQSRFVQENPDGSYSEGTLYLERPGKLRVEYDPPDPYLIIAADNWFMYVDRVLNQPTYLPIKKTPAYFFLRPKFTFGGDVKVTSVQRGNNVVRIELVQANEPDMGQVMLVFTEKPLELRKWRVLDAQGSLTDTTLINPRFGVPLAANLFEYTPPTPTTGSN